MGKSLGSQLKYCLLGVGIGLMALSVSGCLPKEPVPGEGQPEKAEKSNGVLAAMATMKEIPMIFRTRGEIVPSNEVRIQATAPGRVAKVAVHEGQKVTKGTLLLQYDTQLTQEKLDLAQAEAEEADSAIDFEQYRFENRDALLDDQEISSAVYDYIERHLEYERARSKRAKAEMTYLQSLVKEQDVTSPISGTVTSKSIADNMPVVEGQFLLEIVEDDPVKLQVRLPEEYIPATYRGQPLRVKFPDAERGETTVKISEVGVAVDPLTDTFDVFAELENPDGKLKTGMELETTLVTDKKTTILSIPKSAVTLRDNKAVVFRIKDNVAEEVPVKLGQPVGQEVAVVDGVQEGDIVVVQPPSRLRNGDEVEILTTAAQPEPASAAEAVTDETATVPEETPPPPQPAATTPPPSRPPPPSQPASRPPSLLNPGQMQRARERYLERREARIRREAESPPAPAEEDVEEPAAGPEEDVIEEENAPEEEPEYAPSDEPPAQDSPEDEGY